MKAFGAIIVVLALAPIANVYADAPKLVIATETKDLNQLKCLADLGHRVSDMYKASPDNFTKLFGGVDGQLAEIRLIGHLNAQQTMVNENEYQTADKKHGVEFVTDSSGNGCANFKPIQDKMDKYVQQKKAKEDAEKAVADVNKELQAIAAGFAVPADSQVNGADSKNVAPAKIGSSGGATPAAKAAN